MNVRVATVVVILSFLLAGCSRGTPTGQGRDDLYSQAMRLYDGGSDAEALLILGRMAESDDPEDSILGNAILSDIYMVQARSRKDADLARRAIAIDGRLGAAQRQDLLAYRNYRRAVALDVMGDHEGAERIFLRNCERKGSAARCVLMPEFARALETGPRYQREAIHAITSVLAEHQFESEQVLATSPAAMVHEDYQRAQSSIRLLRDSGRATQLVESEFCIAISSARRRDPGDLGRCDTGVAPR